jgi:hypothetical protein
MSKDSLYYLEKLEGESFNLWFRKNNQYFNLATLFYEDKLCGNSWDVSDIDNSVNYSENEINDELESPLINILNEYGEKLLSMKGNSPKEVLNYFKLNMGELK